MKNRFLFPILTFLWLFSLPTFCVAKKLRLPGRAQLIESVVYKETPKGKLCVDIFRPDSTSVTASPVFVFIHGGSWMELNRRTIRSDFRKTMLDKLLQAGFSVVSIDYRLVNYDNDVVYPEPIADCKDAIRWVHKEAGRYHFDATNISVGGCSAGGHLAMMTAYAPDTLAPGDKALAQYPATVNNCIDIYGPTYLGDLLHPKLTGLSLGVAKMFFPKKAIRMREALLHAFTQQSGRHPLRRSKECRRFSPLTYTDNAIPTLILHGNKDKVVPISQAKKLRKKLQKKGITIQTRVLEGENHGFHTIDKATENEIAEATIQFITQHNK